MRLSQGTLFWREVGYGTTVLLLHGNWQSSLQWVQLMTALSPYVHCVAPDLLGFGESTTLPAPVSVDAEVTLLRECLDKLRIRPAVILAEGLGAWVAVRFCLHYPEMVKHLFLMAPEGLAHPVLNRRWERLKWLARSWDIRFWCVRLLTPLIQLGGGDRWLQKILQQRQCLMKHRAACQLLFHRCPSALQVEWLNPVISQLQANVVLIEPSDLSQESQFIHTLWKENLPGTQTILVEGDEQTVWDAAYSSEQIASLQKLLTVLKR
jgi:pimeloyl-ACP methyl ester carboxylesterase